MHLKILVLLSILFLAIPCLAQQPRIDSIAVDEGKGELVLHGDFQNSSSAVVLVDSVSLPVIMASDILIRATIPLSGKGSCGLVSVITNGHQSNKKLLTYWHIWISSIFRHLYSDSGFEDVENDDSIHVRCDILSLSTPRTIECSKLSNFHAKAGGNDGIHGYKYSGPTYDTIGIVAQSVYLNPNFGFYYFFAVPQNSFGGGDMDAQMGFDKNYEILTGKNYGGPNDLCSTSFYSGYCFQWKEIAPTDFPPSMISVHDAPSNPNILQAHLSSDPIKSHAEINVALQNPKIVHIQILDILGHIISSDEIMLQAGENKLPINASAFPSGIYICRLQAGREVVSLRFVKE